MSIEDNEKNYQQNVLNIFKKLCGVREDKQVAEIIGIIPEELANRKRRKTLTLTLFSEAIKRGMDLNQLFYHEKNKEQARRVNIDTNKNKRKFEILDQAENWLAEEVDKNPKREIWFEVEFEKNFQEFKKWKEAKEESEAKENSTSTRKVA